MVEIGKRHPVAEGQAYCGIVLPAEHLGAPLRMCVQPHNHEGPCGNDDARQAVDAFLMQCTCMNDEDREELAELLDHLQGGTQ